MDESTNDGIVNVGDGNDGGAAMNPATGTEPAAQSTDAYSVTYAAAARLNDAPESAAPASVWDEMSHNPQPAAAATHENKPDISDYAKQSKPTFPISQLPDLRETLDPKADMNPEEVKSREEFTTVYDIIDSMEATLEAAKTSLFAPSMVRVDREEFAGQLDELKRMGVVLKRAQYFITCRGFAGAHPGRGSAGRERITRALIDPNVFSSGVEQLSMFSPPAVDRLVEQGVPPRTAQKMVREEAVQCLAKAL